ncbi:peptidase, M16 family protein [Clostridium pasteurianum DSM 525 = ATCC 6013]|uniref:Peptidase, M16 family protein n=1 Tax=Clostridium pasteurianum DSM 525 = ATCC 6013 TaxID=1262449 RepID=A0A0H3J720_CLOPA|nr:pitrilysin family protein [Clostridium pasteurianum]AJA47713.1 peptidase, M16 family protein [Clostridium pasteurianum DSM 525 = ATCC 6013]AJA51701.1 peptidase, M16 family protein [Clostridium pasteurianum DSM 525 = ATCC 6013]AOZ75013.1 peptidase M16 [Clostridium pasteurianum DSM 525 = ATCC 6013]AOZ78808.1 peptidase M16 [Clostridium pasteurianum]ELP59615.1 M16 family peptidase [Clostridium pasteurianum DSM 525 = ATCC 6013]
MDKDIIDYKETKFINGLRIITIKKSTNLFSIHAGIKIGSIYEEKNKKGISHFVEHMLFKGTKSRSNEELNNELESIGGEYNAYTDYNCTVVHVSGLIEEMKKALSLIEDMLVNCNFPEKEIEREKKVILAEIKTSVDDVEDYSFKKAHEIAYKNSPIKYETIGNENTVKNFSRKDICGFYNKYYVPNNCYISIVSSMEHDDIINMVKEYFERWTGRNFKLRDIIIENNIPIKKTTFKKNIEQSSIIYIFTFHNLDKRLELALKILNNKFGESANSILFRELREKRGLAYDVYSELDTSSFVKSLYIYTAVGKENIEKTINCIDNCIEKIKNEEILFDIESINLMKKILKTAIILTLEDTSELCNYALHQMIENEDIYSFLSDMNNLKNIKKEEIYEAAREVLKDPTIHILLPKESDIFE